MRGQMRCGMRSSAKIKADADAALARAKAGEGFGALIEELGTDTGMTQEPAKTKGYLVFEGSGMVAEFEEAALALPFGRRDLRAGSDRLWLSYPPVYERGRRRDPV